MTNPFINCLLHFEQIFFRLYVEIFFCIVIAQPVLLNVSGMIKAIKEYLTVLGELKMFDNYISLGGNCFVAASMSKYGFRSFSGPFDWCKSNFIEGVIPLLETDFQDFMLYENLKVSEGSGEKIFDDLKYKINYNHDVKESLKEEYNDIYEKYQRRIERFRTEIKNPTCFIHGVRTMEELTSIREYEERITRVIKKYSDNEIIFVIPKHIYEANPLKLNFRHFEVDIASDWLDRETGRSFFDSNVELISFLEKNYDSDKRKDNMIFDLRAELDIAKRIKDYDENQILKKQVSRLKESKQEVESRNLRWMRLLNTDFDSISFPPKLSIYGCGAIGRIFYQRAKGYCTVESFIDKSPRQEYYDNVSVLTIEDSVRKGADKETTIIIIPSYDYDAIVESITNAYGFKPSMIKLEEFLSQGKIIDPNF